MKITKRHNDLLDKVCKAFHFHDASDTTTVISRNDAVAAIPVILSLKQQLLKEYPYDFTLKLKGAFVDDPKWAVTVLRQLMRAHKRRVISERKYKWCKSQRKSVSMYRYNLL